MDRKSQFFSFEFVSKWPNEATAQTKDKEGREENNKYVKAMIRFKKRSKRKRKITTETKALRNCVKRHPFPETKLRRDLKTRLPTSMTIQVKIEFCELEDQWEGVVDIVDLTGRLSEGKGTVKFLTESIRLSINDSLGRWLLDHFWRNRKKQIQRTKDYRQLKTNVNCIHNSLLRANKPCNQHYRSIIGGFQLVMALINVVLLLILLWIIIA